ncbi:MAG: alpha/beta fold hydrolase [Planctomycetaceae bacterium]|nr:alpha/beta fold hydrolase [Planctomycetaceae bacterium]
MQHRIEILGTTLSVADVGQGPPILFVHGFPLDHTMWRQQLAEFSRDHRCIAPDLRGFGQSSVTADKVSMEQFADDLAALLDALGITEPIVLCGLSMGGYIAWQFVRRHAVRLRALILCDTRAVPDPPEAAAGRLKLADDVVRLGPELVANAMLPRLFAPNTSAQRPEWVDELRQVMLATNPHGIAAASRGMAERGDARPLLPAIDCPTLVLVGEHDVISPPAEMRDIATSIPNSVFQIIADAGHMAPLEQPLATNAAIRRFIESSTNSLFSHES